MKYYGDSNKKALKAVAYATDDSTIQFVRRKGMFMEYMLEVRECESNEKDDFPCVYEKNVDNFKVKNFRNGKYYIEKGHLLASGNKDMTYYQIYKEVDRFYYAKGFVWRENKKYGVKETTHISGKFEFFIIVKGNGDAHIDVRYTACDNKHRNKVTISTIEVYNASTQEIKNAIEEWKKNLSRELACA